LEIVLEQPSGYWGGVLVCRIVGAHLGD